MSTRTTGSLRSGRSYQSGGNMSGGTGNAGSGSTAIVKKGLSKWGSTGLDISDSGFSKLHAKEQSFESTRKHYDLANETFLTYTDHLIEKVHRMYAKNTFTVADSATPTPNSCFILKEYTKITEDEMKTSRDLRWPAVENFATQVEADKASDDQIKASTVGAYIHASLTEDAKKQLKADEEHFKVIDVSGNPFFDGPSYFWKIAELVDPNNDSLVEDVRTKLRTLNVKNHGYSVIQMLAEFKNLRTRVIELGGTYSNDEQFLDFWHAITTMKEREFARYVTTERDTYRDTPKARRLTIEKYMTKFQKKETSMKSEDKWNVLSPEDSMIMALFSALDSKSSADSTTSIKQRKSKKYDQDSNGKDNNDKPLTDEERKARREARIPDWKKEKPKDSETTQLEKEGRTYHFCTKCRDGEGMWALHETDGHKDNFSQSSSKHQKSSKTSTKDKNVSFAVDTSKDTNKDDSTKENDVQQGPKAKVKASLMRNARAYLAQLENRADFQEGGEQGE